MYKCYGITNAKQTTGLLDAFFQRLAQARRIRRFCDTNSLRLSGNSVTSNPKYELSTAISLWEMGWIDCVVIVSRDYVESIEDDTFFTWISALEEKNALLILDECKLFH